MTAIDLSILDWIGENLHCAPLDTFFALFTHLGDPVVWVVLTAALLVIPKTRKMGTVFLFALLLNVILCNGILKPLAARPRPFTLREVTLLISPPKDWSFPSGHSAAAFAFSAAAILKKCPGRWVMTVIAALIAFSRLYLYVHYPSDVICGLVLGVICGLGGVRLHDFVLNRKRTEK